MTGGTQAEGIHATGQPDTPIEVLTALLTKALQQQTLEQQRTYVQQALDIAAGLDDYLDKISSPPSQVGLAPEWGSCVGNAGACSGAQPQLHTCVLPYLSCNRQAPGSCTSRLIELQPQAAAAMVLQLFDMCAMRL